MKFELNRYGISIIPEDEQDKAYIEDTLGLKEVDSYVKLVRVNAFGMGCIARLETKKVNN